MKIAGSGCAIAMMCLICAGLAGAEERWSDWMFTNDATIEWRWIGHTYGPNIEPNCNFEFRNKLGGKATFNYFAGYSWREAGILDQKKGAAYEVTDTEHGGDSINRCTRVLSMAVSNIKKTQ